MQDRHLCWPLCFFLGPVVTLHFFNFGIATAEVAGVTISDSDSAPVPKFLNPDPLSSEISDLCEIPDLLLFVNYFASQNKKIKFGNYLFDVCFVN